MTKPEIAWFEYEITGLAALGRPIEKFKYRTNADASIVQFWSDKKVPGFAKIGWNTTRSINAEKSAAIALRARERRNEMNEDEKRMFGISKEAIREQYMESSTVQYSGLEMAVASILSDCQEMIAMKNPTIPAPNTDEYIRKQMNIAKFILFEMMDKKETV